MKKWTVRATGKDVLDEVGFIDSGEIDEYEYDADGVVELSDGGYVASFRAVRLYFTDHEEQPVAMAVTVSLAEPAATYADVFRTPWDACDAEEVK